MIALQYLKLVQYLKQLSSILTHVFDVSTLDIVTHNSKMLTSVLLQN